MTVRRSHLLTTFFALASIFADAAFTAATVEDVTPETLTDELVQRAIDAVVEELYSRKHPERFWDPARSPIDESPQTGGYTALVTFALLHAGESYQNERLRDAIEYLEAIEMDGTYAVAVRAGVWAMLPPRFQQNLLADARKLVRGFSREAQGWNYHLSPTTIRRDNSLRQFGALGLWEAAKRGVNVPQWLWDDLEQGYLAMQLADGGWNYIGHGPGMGSMTAAGLATLYITQDLLHARKWLALDGSQRPQENVRGIDMAVGWLDEHFTPHENPGRNRYFFYYLYSIERVGLASGRRTFGGRDWYREGAAELINRFCQWDSETRQMVMHERAFGDGRRSSLRDNELAFGLTFLSRGRVPVAINKLRDDTTAWNNRPRDVANLTEWLSREAAAPLNWQVVALDEDPATWLDAPLLYFASNRPLPWLAASGISVERHVQRHRERVAAARDNDGDGSGIIRRPEPPLPELQHLRQYLDRGGLLLAVNEGNTPHFAQSIEAAGRLMYPDLEWRTLPDDHWAYAIHQPVGGGSGRPVLRGLSNGVRELIILAVDRDLSATLQVRDEQGRRHFHTLANVYLYASEKNRARPRLAGLSVAEGSDGDEAPVLPDRSLTLVEAAHDGAWNPEPLALDQMRAWLNARGDLDLTISAAPLEQIHLIEPGPDLVLIRAIDETDFTFRQREAIRLHAERGGVILLESVGGTGSFGPGAERAVELIFGEPVQPLSRSRVVTGRGLDGAANLSRVDYRPYTVDVLGTVETAPRLRGLLMNGQPRVIVSREDLSHALLDQPCWGISGYAPGSARNLLRNMLLHGAALRDEVRDEREVAP